MGFPGVWTLDSSSPHQITPGKPLLDEIRVYRLPSNHSGPRETDLGFRVPHIKVPLVAWLSLSLSILVENVLLTRLQTNKHTKNHLFRKTLLSVEGMSIEFSFTNQEKRVARGQAVSFSAVLG